MDDQPNATRRTVLKTAGIVAGTAALGAGVYGATSTSSANQSGATEEWYKVYKDAQPRVKSLFTLDDGYMLVTEQRLIKFTLGGNIAQSHRLERADVITDTARTTDGTYLHAGRDSGDEDTNIATASESDAQGDVLWSWREESGDEIQQGLKTAVVGPDGGRYVLGYKGDSSYSPYAIRFDDAGNVLWEETYDISIVGMDNTFTSAVPASDSGVIAKSTDGAVRITPDGTLAWTRTYEDDGIGRLLGLTPQTDGTGYFGCGTNTDGNPVILLLDEQGKLVRTERYTTPADDAGNSITLTENGPVVVGARTVDAEPDDRPQWVYDAYAVGLTETGEKRWYLEPGKTENQDVPLALTGSPESIVMAGGWKEGRDPEGEFESRFITRIRETTETDPSPTETATETKSTDNTATATSTETATDEPTSDEEDCKI